MLSVIHSGADISRSGLGVYIWKTFEYEDPASRQNRPAVPGNSRLQAYLQIFEHWWVMIISITERSLVSVSEKVQTKWLKSKTKRTQPWVYQSSFLAVSLWDRAMVNSILKSHMPQIRSASTFWNNSTYPRRPLWWLECSWARVCWFLGTLHVCLGLPSSLSQEPLLFLFSKPLSKWEGSFAGSSLWAWFQKMTHQSLIIWLSKPGSHLIEIRKSDPSFHGLYFIRKMRGPMKGLPLHFGMLP